uniref:Uncharacterized protein n=1 Tax=Solanum lycopersicum TaxID=4081 RepID=A0A3Q7HBL6_SOLLC
MVRRKLVESCVKELNFCATELQDSVLNKSKGIEDELIIKLKSSMIEVDVCALNKLKNYGTMVVVSEKQPLHPQSFLGTLQMNPFFKSSRNFANANNIFQISIKSLWLSLTVNKEGPKLPDLCKLVIIVVEKLVAIDAVPKAWGLPFPKIVDLAFVFPHWSQPCSITNLPTVLETFIHSFADIFESLGATLNVAKPTKGSFAKPTKGSSVAKFLTGVVGCRRSKNCIGVDLNASIFEQGN